MSLRQKTKAVILRESGKDGSEFEVVFIAEGFSENTHSENNLPILYPGETLSRPEVIEKFDNVPIKIWEFQKGGAKYKTHLPDSMREQYPDGFPKNTVGLGTEPRFTEYEDHDGNKKKGIVGKIRFFDEGLKKILKGAWDAGKRNLVGLSIDAEVVADVVKDTAGKMINKVVDIINLPEVTVVDRPGAGGILLRLTEQSYLEPKAMDQLLALFRSAFPDLVAGITDEMPPEEKWAKFNEVLMSEAGMAAISKLSVGENKEATPPAAATPPATPAGTSAVAVNPLDIPKLMTEVATTAGKVAAETTARVLESFRVAEEKRTAAEAKRKQDFILKVKEAKLPEEEEKFIVETYGDVPVSDDRLNAMLTRAQQKVTRLKESGLYVPGQEHNVVLGKEEYDKQVLAMTGMLTNKKQGDVEQFHSLHQSYREIAKVHGGQEVIARRMFQEIAHCLSPDPIIIPQAAWRSRIQESRVQFRAKEDALALSTWAEVFGDSMRKAMIAFYQEGNWQEAYKLVSEISSAPDFRTMRRVRVGGLADLADVAELGTYQDVTIPADQEETFAVGKKGNLWFYSMEATYNDDLNVLRQIPQMIGRSASRGIYKSILDVIRTNPTMGDGIALFHASHGNLGSTAFSSAQLAAAILAMRDQTELTSGEVLGNSRPRFIVYPNELEQSVWEQARAAMSSVSGRAETVDNWFLSLGLTPLEPVGYWTDTNDWALVADPTVMPTIEISFLNGRREPEILIQDTPNVGSYFTADKIGIKGRIIYAVKALEHRGMFKASVT